MELNTKDIQELTASIDQKLQPYLRCTEISNNPDYGTLVVLDFVESPDLSTDDEAFEKFADDANTWMLSDFKTLFNEKLGTKFSIEDFTDTYGVVFLSPDELLESYNGGSSKVVYRLHDDSEPVQPASTPTPVSSSLSSTSSEIGALFPSIDFAKTRNYAQRNIEIEGVKNLLAEADANETAYLKKKESLIEQNAESLAIAEYAKTQAAGKNAKFSLAWRAGIVVWIASMIIAGFTSGIIRDILTIVGFVAFVAIPVGLIGSFATSSKKRSTAKEYDSMISSLQETASNAANVYGNTNELLYTKIDDLYLSSLDPAHREVVLMRRDQERHHQETLQAQREHNEIIEQEQRRARAAQEESARATQRLLDIEEERERRRKQWS